MIFHYKNTLFKKTYSIKVIIIIFVISMKMFLFEMIIQVIKKFKNINENTYLSSFNIF